MSTEETTQGRPRSADVTPTQIHADAPTRVDNAAITQELHTDAPTRVDRAAVTNVDDNSPTRVDEHSPTAEHEANAEDLQTAEFKTTELKVSNGGDVNKLARLEMSDKPGHSVKNTNARPSAMRLGQMSPEAVQEAVRRVGYDGEEKKSRFRFWAVAVVGGVLAFVTVSLAIRARPTPTDVPQPATAAGPTEAPGAAQAPTRTKEPEQPKTVPEAANHTAPSAAAPVEAPDLAPEPTKAKTAPKPVAPPTAAPGPKPAGVGTNPDTAPKRKPAKPNEPDDLLFPPEP